MLIDKALHKLSLQLLLDTVIVASVKTVPWHSIDLAHIFMLRFIAWLVLFSVEKVCQSALTLYSRSSFFNNEAVNISDSQRKQREKYAFWFPWEYHHALPPEFTFHSAWTMTWSAGEDLRECMWEHVGPLRSGSAEDRTRPLVIIIARGMERGGKDSRLQGRGSG